MILKNKLNVKNKKITNISNIYEFYYEHSNSKVGDSENNLQIEIDENREELINNFYFKKILRSIIHYQVKNFSLLKK